MRITADQMRRRPARNQRFGRAACNFGGGTDGTDRLCPVETEDLARYAKTFNESYPYNKINWVRDSAGIITTKLLAGRDNPQADFIRVLAATSHLILKSKARWNPMRPRA